MQGPCIFGLELNRYTVFLGPAELLSLIREYILLCEVHRELGDLLTRALGATPYRGESALQLVNARIAVKKEG